MNADKRKQLRDEYKSKQQTGGVYAIVCSGNNKRYIRSSVDLEGIQNRFRFAQSTRCCPEPWLRDDWTQFGTDSLSMVVLEELQKKEDQTPREFAEDVKLLCDMWLEKESQE